MKLTKEERDRFWAAPLTGKSEQHAWLQAYEDTVIDLGQQLADKDAQIAVLAEAIEEVLATEGAHPEIPPEGSGRCYTCEALTPDLVAQAARYREALAVMERVKAAIAARRMLPEHETNPDLVLTLSVLSPLLGEPQ